MAHYEVPEDMPPGSQNSNLKANGTHLPQLQNGSLKVPWNRKNRGRGVPVEKEDTAKILEMNLKRRSKSLSDAVLTKERNAQEKKKRGRSTRNNTVSSCRSRDRHDGTKPPELPPQPPELQQPKDVKPKRWPTAGVHPPLSQATSHDSFGSFASLEGSERPERPRISALRRTRAERAQRGFNDVIRLESTTPGHVSRDVDTSFPVLPAALLANDLAMDGGSASLPDKGANEGGEGADRNATDSRTESEAGSHIPFEQRNQVELEELLKEKQGGTFHRMAYFEVAEDMPLGSQNGSLGANGTHRPHLQNGSLKGPWNRKNRGRGIPVMKEDTAKILEMNLKRRSKSLNDAVLTSEYFAQEKKKRGRSARNNTASICRSRDRHGTKDHKPFKPPELPPQPPELQQPKDDEPKRWPTAGVHPPLPQATSHNSFGSFASLEGAERPRTSALRTRAESAQRGFNDVIRLESTTPGHMSRDVDTSFPVLPAALLANDLARDGGSASLPDRGANEGGEGADRNMTGSWTESRNDSHIPFEQRNQAEREEFFMRCTYMLAMIGDQVLADYKFINGAAGAAGGQQRPVQSTCASETGASCSVSAGAIAAPGVGCNYAAEYVEIGQQILADLDGMLLTFRSQTLSRMVMDVIMNNTYQSFCSTIESIVGQDVGMWQLAIVFKFTKAAVSAAHSMGRNASSIRDNSVRFFIDRFATWLESQEGWGSVVELMSVDSDSLHEESEID